MRLGLKNPDGFVCTLNDTYGKIRDEYSDIMKSLITSKKIKVMLGDSSVTEESTFEPGSVVSFYRKTSEKLSGWSVRDVMITNNEDCRRVFIKFESRVGRYLVSGHLSLQFHVLLYYKPEYRVVECQKELSKIIEDTKDAEKEMADAGDRLIVEKFGETVKNDEDLQKLFEQFYNDGQMTEELHRMIEQSGGSDVNEMMTKKQRLFKELDGYLIETYRTTDTLIDDARLVTGEEGFLCTFDIEVVNEDNSHDGLFDTAKILSEEKDGIMQAVKEFGDAVRRSAT